MENRPLLCSLSRSFLSFLLCCAFGFSVASCTSLGARALKGERIQLNAAFQQTNDEQLLLNLVRLRYRDTPAFLEVSSISTQPTFETTVQAGAELERADADTDLFTFGAGAVYTTQPTLTYTPLQGDAFIQRLLTPLTIEKLMLLYQSGWNIKRIFLLGVRSMNNVRNAPRASGPTPGRAPEYGDFSRAVEILLELERRGLVDIAYESASAKDASPTLILQIDPKASSLPLVVELRRILNLSPSQTRYPIVYAQVQHVHPLVQTSIEVDTRSLLGIMYYLSQAVEAPAADVQRGKVTVTKTETGEPFDWGVLLGGIFKIKTGGSRPADAATAVRYRGAWFYIDDSDLDSKSTFVMLSQIFSLQAGKAEGIAPVLTLPVGR
jgi:hypothetical protein